MQDIEWMQRALELALLAKAKGEVPVGAIIVQDNNIIGQGYNQPIARNDPTAHAEIIAIRVAAEQVANYRLLNSTLYVTLEPCEMCLGAIIHARIERLVFAAFDPKKQHDYSKYTNLQVINGILEIECSTVLKDFFRAKRV